MEISDGLTHWTARLAVACYALRLSADIASWNSPRAKLAVLWIWTAGCLFLVVHVICAFQFDHHWSHSEAYEHTARRTAVVVGFHWGGGLYLNYLFLGFWIGDVAAWWWFGSGYATRRWVFWIVHAVFAFMIVNATIVFGPPFWRWVGLIAAGIPGLGGLISAWRRASR